MSIGSWVCCSKHRGTEFCSNCGRRRTAPENPLQELLVHVQRTASNAAAALANVTRKLGDPKWASEKRQLEIWKEMQESHKKTAVKWQRWADALGAVMVEKGV